jgi:glycosyltransferase involved in cell wall biosynthesis
MIFADSGVSVVILTRNSARTINRCLKSVLREKPSELLAVDGASTDGTREILRQYGVTILVENTRSMGASRQIGVQAAKGIYVMFVDSDVELAPGCIRVMRRDLETHGWAGVHARLMSAENVSYWQRAEDEKFRREYDRAGPVNRIDTITALFRRDILLACPFDRNLRESFEDVDLSRRLVKNNHQLGVSSAIAYHYHRRAFSAFARQRFRYGLGRAHFYSKDRKIRTLIDPLLNAIYQILHDSCAGRVWLIPYWAAEGVVVFLGVVVGVSRARWHKNDD